MIGGMDHPPEFVDGFPASPRAPDYAVHAEIDRELRNCHGLQGTYATKGQLFPGYFASGAEQKSAWLDAALARAEWHAGREPWTGYLASLIDLLLSDVKTIADQSLFRLVRLGPELYRQDPARVCFRLGESVAGALAKSERRLAPEQVESLRKLVYHMTSIHPHSEPAYAIAWHLFRAEKNTVDGDPCFSASVRRDLRGMDPSESKRWDRLWALIRHRWSMETDRKHLERIKAAVDGIGTERFTACLTAWIGQIESDQPAYVSPAGKTLLRHLILTCQALPEVPVDDALFRLCGLRWAGAGSAGPTLEWLGTLLATLGTRPPDKAFACAERLANYPDTSRFPEVQRFYSLRLGEAIGDAVPSRAEKGVDGFPFALDPQHRRQQDRLDGFLKEKRVPTAEDFAAGAQQTFGGKGMVKESLLRQSTGELPETVRAAMTRIRWLSENRPADEHQDLFWRCGIGELLCDLLRSKPELNRADLIGLLEIDGLGYLGVAPSSLLLELAEERVAKHGYEPELMAALEPWQKTLHGSIAAQDLRHKASWLLWFDPVSFDPAAAISEKDCWSHRIRADLRGMDAGSRRAWETLLKNISFSSGDKPPGKWKKPAAKALQAVGAAAFRERVRAWFSPFRAGEVLRITVIGRDVLRNLMWYALPAADAQVDQAISWFAASQWKTKDDKGRIAKLLPSFAHVLIERSPELAFKTLENYSRAGAVPLAGKTLSMYRQLRERLGKAAPAAPLAAEVTLPKPDDIVRAFLKKNLAGAATVEGDDLVVKGTLDSYRINMKDSRMVRLSDGKAIRVEIDVTEPPYGPFRAMLDGPDIQNPFAPNYFRLLVCAQILARDAEERDRIVGYEG